MNCPSNTTGKPTESQLPRAYIGIGSNLDSPAGSPGQTLLAVMDRLAAWSDFPLLRSSLWLTDPVDCPPGAPAFVNAVAGLVPSAAETPQSLLARLLDLELQFGRQRPAALNAPRSLDLDLIAFADHRLATDSLTLPHPEAHRRGFVLQPLAEIAPQLILPGQTRSVAQLAAALRAADPLVAKIQC